MNHGAQSGIVCVHGRGGREGGLWKSELAAELWNQQAMQKCVQRTSWCPCVPADRTRFRALSIVAHIDSHQQQLACAHCLVPIILITTTTAVGGLSLICPSTLLCEANASVSLTQQQKKNLLSQYFIIKNNSFLVLGF